MKPFKQKSHDFKVISVDRVVDGDTIDATLDLGFRIHIQRRFRLAGYDAPETWRPKSEAERKAGKRVKQFLEEQIEVHKENLRMTTTKDAGIYGRYTGVLYDPTKSESINTSVFDYIIENKLEKDKLDGKE